jgi:hypothetical protein
MNAPRTDGNRIAWRKGFEAKIFPESPRSHSPYEFHRNSTVAMMIASNAPNRAVVLIIDIKQQFATF